MPAKRCLFSNADIGQFKWFDKGSYVCYPCYVRKADEHLAKDLVNSIRIENVMEKATATEPKKRKSKKLSARKIKIKVDSRVIEKGVIPPLKIPDIQAAHFFDAKPKLEGPLWPKIHYPYITSCTAG